MTVGAFDGYENCTWQFLVPTGELATDSAGNPVPLTTAVPARAKLQLKTERAELKTNRPPGVPVDALYVEGNLIEPIEPPAGVLLPVEMAATLDGRGGRLHITHTLRDAFGVWEVTGFPLKCYWWPG